MKHAAMIATAFLLTGCAEHYVWYKPDQKPGQFEVEFARCKMYAQATTPQIVPQQLPPNYVANTDYSGTYNRTFGTTTGTATTTIQAQPNPWNGVSAIAAGLGNRKHTTENAQTCLEANGWRKQSGAR